ncbi:MAG: 4'-phosphopantetheinyl transferase family protein [Ramlibacter sp.]
MQASELQVWTARPADCGPTLPGDLGRLLDDAERERAARFRHEADRCSYVVVHALRRSVLARWLAIDPREIVFAHEPGGRPVLIHPRDDKLFFSHTRSRDAVACAVTRLGPIGLDVEKMEPGGADDDMLARFVVLDDESGRRETADDKLTARFYFHWTALEAFWKAEGKGLADGNPRIECRRNARGCFEVWVEGDSHGPRARLFRIQLSDAACIALALRSDVEVRPQLFNGNMQLCSATAGHEMLSPR